MSRVGGPAAVRLLVCAFALAGAWAWLALPGAPLARAAGVPVKLSVSADAEEGAINLLRAAVSTEAGARCELSVSAGGRSKTMRSRRSGSVVWSWTEPANAPAGVWTFLATCRRGGEWGRWHESFELGFPRPGRALLTPQQSAAAGGSGSPSCDSQNVCFAGDPFEIGQCGWYARGLRPDLDGIVGILHDDSGAWLEEAAGKVPEGSIPVVGALAVWVPNVPGYSGEDGHVAYVAAVSGSRIFVYDSNWKPTSSSPGLEVHEHWDGASSVSGYIYGGPAGAGP